VSVSFQPADNYQRLLPRTLGHVEIAYNSGNPLELPDGSEIYLSEFGVFVAMPGPTPNRFIPYGSIREIVEAPVPASAARLSPDDGQVHD
jgi:hypothetical protein